MTHVSVDVAVVGTNTAGLATAIGLAQSGLDVVAIDAAPAPRRAWTAIQHWAVLPVLDALGVLDDALIAGEATAHWGLRMLRTGEQIEFDLRELGSAVPHSFNLRLEPRVLLGILRDRLTRLGALQIGGTELRDLRQRSDGVDLRLADGTSIRAGWVVGADGSASTVRRAAGLGFEGTTWTERAVGAVVRHDFGAAGYLDTTFQVDEANGAVVERMGRRTWRYLFQESLALDAALIEGRLQAVLRRVTGAQVPVLGWSTARMHQRSASSYRSGRVLLVGDAAHVTHPMVGHASVSGWLDAMSLVPVLVQAAVDGGRGADEGAFDQWAEARRRSFLDDEAPLSLARMNLVARTPDATGLEAEFDAYRRASLEAATRRAFLVSDGGVAGEATFLPPTS